MGRAFSLNTDVPQHSAQQQQIILYMSHWLGKTGTLNFMLRTYPRELRLCK